MTEPATHSYGNGRKPTISDSTGVTIGLLVVAMGLVAGGTYGYAMMVARLDGLITDMHELRVEVALGITDRWRREDMEAWVKRANREVEVWSLLTERTMGFEPNTYPRFEFPSPGVANE